MEPSMSDTPCIDPSELEGVIGLPDDHPVRQHARACPRCASLLESFRLYLEPGPDARAAHVAEADASLARAIERMTGTGAPARAAARPSRSWFGWLTGPGLRPALAVAALVLIAGGALVWTRLRSPDEGIMLRGGQPGAAREITVTEARLDEVGLTLAWHEWPGADGYTLRFYSSDLDELGHLTVARRNTLVLRRGQLPFAPEGGDVVLVRVQALRDGDVVASSPAQPLKTR
jgi:hypothetical protein